MNVPVLILWLVLILGFSVGTLGWRLGAKRREKQSDEKFAAQKKATQPFLYTMIASIVLMPFAGYLSYRTAYDGPKSRLIDNSVGI